MRQRRRLARNEPHQYREDSEEEERHDQQEDDRRQKERLVDFNVSEETTRQYFPPVIKFPEDDSADDQDADVEIVAVDEWDGWRPRRAQLVKQQSSPAAESGGYGVNDEAGKARNCGHDEGRRTDDERKKLAVRHFTEEGEHTGQRHSHHGQEWRDNDRYYRHHEAFESVDAEYLRCRHASGAQERGVRLSAADEVRNHHDEEEQDGCHHERLQQQQRHAGEEASGVEPRQHPVKARRDLRCSRHSHCKLRLELAEAPANPVGSPPLHHLLVEADRPDAYAQRSRERRVHGLHQHPHVGYQRNGRYLWVVDSVSGIVRVGRFWTQIEARCRQPEIRIRVGRLYDAHDRYRDDLRQGEVRC